MQLQYIHQLCIMPCITHTELPKRYTNAELTQTHYNMGIHTSRKHYTSAVALQQCHELNRSCSASQVLSLTTRNEMPTKGKILAIILH